MATAAPLHLTVITPARSVLDAEAAAVVVPAYDGELGILPGHAPLIALLGTGTLRVTGADGGVRHLVVRGGFVQIKDNEVSVLTPESLAAEELDGAKLEAEVQQLQSEHPTRPEEREALAKRFEWAVTRQKTLARRKE